MATWKEIPDFPTYMVSDEGQVRLGDKILRTYTVNAGYQAVRLGPGRKGALRNIHRLVLTAFLGSSGLNGLHRNGDPSDNRLQNLYWGTQKQNMADTISHGRTTRGRKNSQVKLTESQVLDIRLLHATGMLQKHIAPLFGVSTTQVSVICRRAQWAWL